MNFVWLAIFDSIVLRSSCILVPDIDFIRRKKTFRTISFQLSPSTETIFSSHPAKFQPDPMGLTGVIQDFSFLVLPPAAVLPRAALGGNPGLTLSRERMDRSPPKLQGMTSWAFRDGVCSGVTPRPF